MNNLPAEIQLLPPRGTRARRLALALLILAPFAFGALAVFLGQDANWDLRNYHWYNAYAFLNGRDGFDLLPSQTPYFYNPLIDVPFYLLATHVPARMAGFALGWVQGLNFILLFMLAHASLTIASARMKVVVCAALAALGMLGGGGIAQIGTTFYDNVTSLGIFLSALLVVRYSDRLINPSPALREREGPIAQRWEGEGGAGAKPALTRLAPEALGTLSRKAGEGFYLAFLFGIPAGLAMGLKLPAVIFCLGLCFAFFGTGGAWTRRFWLSFAFGLGVLLGFAVAYGSWGWFLDTHYASPFFPYFNNYFKSPFAPPASVRDIQYVPNNAKDFFLFPFIFAQNPYRVGEIPWRDWRIPMLYALLPAALLLRLMFGRARGRADSVAQPYAARYLLWTAIIAYFAWDFVFGVYRYILPLEMLAPLLIVFAAGLLPLRLPTRGLVAGALLLVVAFSVRPGNWTRRNAWLDHFVEATVPPLGDMSDLMILMAGIEPYSHLVTQFPPRIPFVRIQSNFVNPDPDDAFNLLIRKRVTGHKGRFLMLIPPWQHDVAQKALAPFRLALAPKPCQTVVDRLYDDRPMDLCRVIPSPALRERVPERSDGG